MTAETPHDPASAPLPAPRSYSVATPAPRAPAFPDYAPRGFQENEGVRLIMKVAGLLAKHWAMVAVICGLGVFAGLVATFLMARVYTATTTIQIDREAAKVVRNQDALMDHGGMDPQFYTTQFELLKSRALAERVVGALALADDPAFLAPKGSFLSRIFGGAGGNGEAAPAAQRRKAAIAMVQGGTQIQPVPGSRIVKVSFSARSPELAQKIAIGLAENYVGMTLDRRFSASAYARSFLEEKLQQLKVKLEDSEKQVVAYAQKEGIVNVDDKLSVAGANLKALNDSLAAATAERIRKEQIWATAQAGNAAGLPQMLEDKLIEKAQDKRAQLMAEYQDKLRLMKPDFPEMVQLKAQIAEYDRQIKSQGDVVKKSMKTQFEAARDQEASFKAKIESLKTEVLDLRNRSIKYNILQREVDTNRSLYDGLLQQYKEVGVTGAVATNNVQIIDKAELPTSPSSPSLTLNLLLALIGGLLLSAGAILVREFLDDTFVAPEDVEETLGLHVLGLVPVAKKPENGASIARAVLEDPHSAIAEAFRSLRTTLQFSTAAGLPKVLLVVSSKPSEGKSFTSMCLAANFAQLGMRVLLIDADLRKASLHRELGVAGDRGLSNVLTGAMSPEEVAHENVVPGVTLIASGPLPPNPAELLAGPRFSALLSTAAENFDLVVIDGPPVMGLADAPLLGSIVDGALLVVDSSGTRRRLVQAAIKRLHFSRTNLLGVLLNRYDAGKAAHAYGYGYGYARDDFYGYGAPQHAPAPPPTGLPEA